MDIEELQEKIYRNCSRSFIVDIEKEKLYYAKMFFDNANISNKDIVCEKLELVDLSNKEDFEMIINIVEDKNRKLREEFYDKVDKFCKEKEKLYSRDE